MVVSAAGAIYVALLTMTVFVCNFTDTLHAQAYSQREQPLKYADHLRRMKMEMSAAAVDQQVARYGVIALINAASG